MYKLIQNVELKQVIFQTDMENVKLEGSPHAVELVRELIGDNAREVFLAVYTREDNTVVGYYEAFKGSLNASIVSPREAFQPVFLHKGITKLLVAHPHPSGSYGSTEPSTEDVEVTKRLKEVAERLNIKLVDHIIINQTEDTSMLDKGFM